MNKLVIVPLLASAVLLSQYSGSTTGVVTLVGSYIKAHDAPINSKYPRKDCPVCKGTGKYLSGDGIKMVDCGYCEPEKKDLPTEDIINSVVDKIDQDKKQFLSDTIILYVKVPTDNTQVTINGYEMKKGLGINRMYISDKLQKGYEYDYSVRVFYEQNGKHLQEVRVFRVVGGEKRYIDFTK